MRESLELQMTFTWKDLVAQSIGTARTRSDLAAGVRALLDRSLLPPTTGAPACRTLGYPPTVAQQPYRS